MNGRQPARIGVVAAFFLGTAGIACAAIFIRMAAPAPAVTVAFYRMAFATSVLGAILLATGRSKSPGAARWPASASRMAMIAGVCFAFDMALWHTAVATTSVANATLLVNTTPLYVGLFAVVVQRQRLPVAFAVGAAIALGGCALLLGVAIDATRLRGDLLALIAALFYSAYLLSMKRVRSTLPALPAVFLAGVAATAVLGACNLALAHPFRGFPASSWAAMLAAALVSHLGGVLGIVWALRYMPTTFASVALLAQPVGTAVLGWWLLDEPLSGLQSVGGGAALVGIAIASRATRDV